MTGSMPELLKSLLDTVSPAGCEDETREVFASALWKTARVTVDRIGNTLAVLNPGAPFRFSRTKRKWKSVKLSTSW